MSDSAPTNTARSLTFVVATEYAVQSFASIESAFAGLSLLWREWITKNRFIGELTYSMPLPFSSLTVNWPPTRQKTVQLSCIVFRESFRGKHYNNKGNKIDALTRWNIKKKLAGNIIGACPAESCLWYARFGLIFRNGWCKMLRGKHIFLMVVYFSGLFNVKAVPGSQ